MSDYRNVLGRAIWPAAVLTASWASGAFAADQATTKPQQAAGGQLEEIVVTANRREENSQTVPIAITAIEGDAATKQGIGNVLTLGESIPNVVFGRQSNGSIPFIRGVGNQNSTPGDEPAVAIFVDDVYLPLAGSGISNFNSIERLEVEKGPQGTLFGRNATGGVIQIYTKNPTKTPTMDVNIGYANYKTTSGSIYASGALTSTLSANIAAYVSNQDGAWGRNLTNGHPAYGDERFSGVRGKLLWEPTEKTSFLLTADYDATRSGVGITYRPAPGTETTCSFFGACIPPAKTPAPAGFFDTSTNSDNVSNNYQGGVSLKATFNMDWASLTSVTAYRTNNDQEYFDLDAGRLQLLDAYLHGSDKTWTQEFRLSSPESASFKWIAGVYYFNDKAGYLPIRFQSIAAPGVHNFVSSYGEQKTDSYAVFGQASKEIFPKATLTAGIRYTSDKRSVDNAYNSSDLEPLVTGGSDKFGICPDTTTPNVLAGGAPVCWGGSGSATFSKISGKLALDYRFTDDVMGYVAYNRGFKSGLFNVVALFSELDPPVKPETLDAFTIGEKAEFLDHRLRFNAEAFYYNYKNIQVQAVINGTSHTTNAAKASMKGVEFDVTAVPVEHLTITASLGIERGQYDDFPNGFFLVYDPVNGGNCTLGASTNPAAPGCGLSAGGPGLPPHFVPGNGTTPQSWNLKGNKIPNLPPLSASIAVKYDVPAESGDYDVNVAWNHGGDYYFNADNGKGQVAPSTPDNNKQQVLDLLNASVGWTSKSGTWGARLWGKNITDVGYLAFGLEDAYNTQWAVAPPRTYGVNFSYHH